MQSFKLYFGLIVFTIIIFNYGLNHLEKIERTVVIDRFKSNRNYLVHPIKDKTWFIVNQPIWLKQFDLPKIYSIVNNDKINITAKISFIEVNNSIKTEKFSTQIILNSTIETKIKLLEPFLLQSNNYMNRFSYEIYIETENNLQLVFDEELAFGLFDIYQFYGNYIQVVFVENGPKIKPKFLNNEKYSISQGTVKRFHFTYNLFGK